MKGFYKQYENETKDSDEDEEYNEYEDEYDDTYDSNMMGAMDEEERKVTGSVSLGRHC